MLFRSIGNDGSNSWYCVRVLRSSRALLLRCWQDRSSLEAVSVRGHLYLIGLVLVGSVGTLVSFMAGSPR